MATDLQILQALRAAVNAQLGGAGPVTLARMGKAIQRGLNRLNESTFTTPAAGQFARTLPDGQRNYMISFSGGRVAELHVYATGAALHVYAGTIDTDAGGPVDGLTAYYNEDVDRTLVPDDTTALTWLQGRINSGLPVAP